MAYSTRHAHALMWFFRPILKHAPIRKLTQRRDMNLDLTACRLWFTHQAFRGDKGKSRLGPTHDTVALRNRVACR